MTEIPVAIVKWIPQSAAGEGRPLHLSRYRLAVPRSARPLGYRYLASHLGPRAQGP
jgi:hypothetical protein